MAMAPNLGFNSFSLQDTTLKIIAEFNQTQSGHSSDRTLSTDMPFPIKVSANYLSCHSWLEVIDISHFLLSFVHVL